MAQSAPNHGVPDILARIVAYKKEEVAERRRSMPLKKLEAEPWFNRPVFSLAAALKNGVGTGIIAEFKRRSPSKGIINADAGVESVAAAYAGHGAIALSILTDEPFFGGSPNDIARARQHPIPILRKDFMIDPYQITEARSMGADVILLIAACLTPAETRTLAACAHDLQLEVLLEIHEENELDRMNEFIDVVGINNRDLRSFTVDLDRSVRLLSMLPGGLPKIAESGIRDPETVLKLRRAGFDGFLIGEQFMKQPDPGIAFAGFAGQLKRHQL